MQKLKDNPGLIFLISSIVIYFLMELPFNLSVRCGNVNEGYYFGYGQHFLEGSHLYKDIYAARGPLFILFYALVLKIFGFGTWSIIAIHFLHSMIVSLIAIAIYLTSKKIFQSSFYSGLAVLFWTLIQLSPIGGWGLIYELESSFSLEAEYFCVLFSLLSIYYLFSASKGLSFISGIFATCSMMFKGNGTAIVVSVLCFVIYLFLFQNKLFKDLKFNFLYFFTGFLFSFLLTLLGLFIHNGELNSFLGEYYTLGYYSNETVESFTSIFKTILRFMLKDVDSNNNFFLFLFTFLIFAWGLFKPSKPYFVLICLWGIGCVCAIITPGKYSSYYYTLIWPSVAIALSYGLKELFTNLKFLNNLFSKTVVIILISLFFFNRFQITFPVYLNVAKKQIELSVFNQKESFQDPIEVSNEQNSNPKRPPFLKIADKINSYLPNKKDSFYIFNFVIWHQDFSATIYIYTKRIPSSTVYSDWLHVENLALVNKSMGMLIRDLMERPPKILIIPKNLKLKKWQLKPLTPFFNTLNLYLQQKYHVIDTIEYKFSPRKSPQALLILERDR